MPELKRQHAWVCTGCLASWSFRTTEDAVLAEQARRLHRCTVEGATTVLVEGDSIGKLTRRFGRGHDGDGLTARRFSAPEGHELPQLLVRHRVLVARQDAKRVMLLRGLRPREIVRLQREPRHANDDLAQQLLVDIACIPAADQRRVDRMDLAALATQILVRRPRRLLTASVQRVRPELELARDLDVFLGGRLEPLEASGNGAAYPGAVFEPAGAPVASIRDLRRDALAEHRSHPEQEPAPQPLLAMRQETSAASHPCANELATAQKERELVQHPTTRPRRQRLEEGVGAIAKPLVDFREQRQVEQVDPHATREQL